MTNSLGTLFLIATPIGNLEDISYRAIRVLKEVDELYCEDTRRTAILLRHYKIEKENNLKSFHDYSKSSTLIKFREILKEGKNVAFVTDGGMPVISDPGYVLVRECIGMGVKIEIIPGPSAGISLFSVSALETPKFLFHGFFPQTKGEIEKVLQWIREIPVAHIFYESPKRLLKTSRIFSEHFPEAQVVLGRELTKMHEEIIRKPADKMYEELQSKTSIRGECVIAIHFKAEQSNPNNTTESQTGDGPVESLTESQKQEILQRVRSGISSKDLAKEISKKYGLSRRIIYEFIIKNLT